MQEQPITGDNEGDENAAQVEGPARQVNGENVHFSDGLAFNVTANQTMTMTDAAAMVVGVGGDMVMSDGGAMIVGVGHDLKMMDGGALSMQVGGNAEVTNGGALVLLGNEVHVHNGSIGVNFSRQTNLSEESRVMLDTPQALAFGAAFGAVFGIVFALISRVFRKR